MTASQNELVCVSQIGKGTVKTNEPVLVTLTNDGIQNELRRLVTMNDLEHLDNLWRKILFSYLLQQIRDTK